MDELLSIKNIENKHFGVIYCVENILNGKKYVGQTTRPLRVRWLQHISDSKRNGFRGLRRFARAIKKYGKNNFKVCVLDHAENYDDLNEKEIFWIDKMNSFQKGYNSNQGGKGKGISEEVRKKISKASKNRIISEETRLKMIESAKTSLGAFREGKNHPFSKTIYKLDPNNFSIVEEFASISLAGKEKKNRGRGAIEYAVKHKGSSGGYFWVYKDDYSNIKDFKEYFKHSAILIKKQRKIKRNKIQKEKLNKRTILQLDINDFHVVNEFNSIIDILKYLGKNENSDIIYEALRTKREKEGFYWIRHNEYKKMKDKNLSKIFLPKFVTMSETKILGKVNQINDNGSIIKVWENCSYAQRTLFNKGHGIYDAIKTGKKYNGFYWELVKK